MAKSLEIVANSTVLWEKGLVLEVKHLVLFARAEGPQEDS
jgi:hypothetical protein